MSKLQRGLLTLAIGLGLWFFPCPEGLDPKAWQLFAIFFTTIAGFIIQPLPIGAIALMAVTFSMISGVLKPAEALSGYSNATIWLIVSAFLFATGFIKTGLGKRIAYALIRRFGESSLKLGYVFAVCELIFAPATPSNTARAGGIIYPIVSSLSEAYGSTAENNPRRIGSFLFLTEYQLNCISSAMFMTAMTGNPIIAGMASEALGVQISWGLWALAGLVPGIISMIVIPYFLFKVYPPEIINTPEAKELAREELNKIGPLSAAEKMLGGIFLLALTLWATASYTGQNATAIALLGVCLMLVCNIVNWRDVIENKSAWDTLVWMGTLISLASGLVKLKFIAWFSTTVGAALVGIPGFYAFVLIILIYTYSHYGFASMVAHIVALYTALATLAVNAGVPPYVAALSLAFLSSICGSLTHYAAGPAPIYFGAGFVEQKTWWRLGFFISIINLIIWVGIGSAWWKVLGLW